MSGGLQYDKDASKQLIAVYVTPDVVAQRQKILQALKLKVGERVLDIGSGPGLLASSMGEMVGISGSVCGVDVSEHLLEMSSDPYR